MSAKTSTLSELHAELADAMRDKLKDPANLTASDLSAIAKFLKDNGIEAEVDDPQMHNLAEEASNVTQFPFDAAAEG